MARSSWNDLREQARERDPEAFEAAYEQSRIADEAAQLVYDLRTKANLSQQQLAKRMGTKQSVIARLEGGGRVPSLQTLARVAAATGGRLELKVRQVKTAAKKSPSRRAQTSPARSKPTKVPTS